MLPCYGIVRQVVAGTIEVVVIDSVTSWQVVDNQEPGTMAGEVLDKLKRVLNQL